MDQYNSVAIIGLAGSFPGAISIDQFWTNLKAGQEQISYWEDSNQDERFRGAKGVMPEATHFKSEIFGINDADARVLDPQMRKLLEFAWTALDDAGVQTSSTEGTDVAVYVSTATSEHSLAAQTDIELRRNFGALHVRLLTDRDFAATRLSYHLNLTGPAATVQTACSSSLVAVHHAVTAVLLGDTQIALAGGIGIDAPGTHGYHWQEGGIGSKGGRIRPYDEQADGAVGGNGGGLVVLKRLKEAIDDGDHIYATIEGSAIGNDGNAKVGFTAPSVDGHARVIVDAWRMAGESPARMDYFEGHGTGTAIGDPIEIAALASARSQNACDDAEKAMKNTVIGSVKGNIGHLDTGAGIASLVKAALITHHRMFVPTPGLEKPAEKLNFSDRQLRICRETERAESDCLMVGVSSLGIGGTNAHMVLRSYTPPAETPAPIEPRLFPVSADSENDAAVYSEQLADHIENRSPRLDAVSSTLKTGRRKLTWRASVVARDEAELANKLRTSKFVRTSEGAPRVSFVFPGQTAYSTEIGKELIWRDETYRFSLEQSASVLTEWGIDPRISVTDLGDTRTLQPVVVAHQIALLEALRAHGIHAQEAIGHSLGEFSALVARGFADPTDVLRAVAARGRLMSETAAGRMIAVRITPERFDELGLEKVSVAAYNAADRIVLSGSPEAIGETSILLRKQGIAHLPLPSKHGFHSALMDPKIDEMAQIAEKLVSLVNVSPQDHWDSSVTGGRIPASEIVNAEYWVKQLRQPVRWLHAAEILDANSDLIVECGDGSELTHLSRLRSAKATLVSCRPRATVSEYEQFLHTLGTAWVKGVDMNWSPVSTQRVRVPLPSHPMRGRNFESFAFQAVSQHTTTQRIVARMDNEATPPIMAGVQIHEEVEDSTGGVVGQIIASVLGPDAIKEDLSFLESGGDSLAAVQVVARIQDEFGFAVDMSDLLVAENISEFISRMVSQVVVKDSETTDSLEELFAEFASEDET